MDLELLSILPHAPGLLGVSVTRFGEYCLLSGGFEQFSSSSSSSLPGESVVLRGDASAFPRSLTAAAATPKLAPLASQQRPAVFLQLRLLHVPSASWTGRVISSNGLCNRAFHASAAIGEEVFLFGGVQREREAVQGCASVVRVAQGVFGLKACELRLSQEQQAISSAAGLAGLSATVCGPAGDCVLLFGGVHWAEQTYSNGVFLFRATEEEVVVGGAAVAAEQTEAATSKGKDAKDKKKGAKDSKEKEKEKEVEDSNPPKADAKTEKRKVYSFKAVEIDVAGSVHGTPPPRAFHSAVLAVPDPSEPHRAFLVVHGGESLSAKKERVCLRDLWVLDLTDVLAAEYGLSEREKDVAEAAQTKGGKGKKGDAAPARTNAARWTRLADDTLSESLSLSARCKHTACVVRETAKNTSIWSSSAAEQATESERLRLLLFGGLSSHGALPLSVCDSLSLSVDMSTKTLSLSPSHTHMQTHARAVTLPASLSPPLLQTLLPETERERVYGAALSFLLSTDFESEKEKQRNKERGTGAAEPVGVLVFGGFRELENAVVSEKGSVSAREKERKISPRARSPLLSASLSLSPSLSLSLSQCDTVRLISLHNDNAFKKRVRQAVLRAHAHIEGMRVPPESARDRENEKLRKIVRYPNGDVYEGEVVRFKARDKEGESMSVATPTVSARTREKQRQDWHDDSRRGPHWGRERECEPEVDDEEDRSAEGIPDIHVPHGEGCMRYATGDVYEGEWCEGERHGRGRLSLHNKDLPEHPSVYEGDFEHDQRTGRGSWLSVSPFVALPGSLSASSPATSSLQKTTFSGSFLNGLFHGRGSLVVEDNAGLLAYKRVFEGDFVHGRKHGRGVVRTVYLGEEAEPEGEIRGEWRDDKLVGFAEATGLRVFSLNDSLGHIPGDSQNPFHCLELFLSPSTSTESERDQEKSVASNVQKVERLRREKLWMRGRYSGTVVAALDNSLSILSPAAFVPYAEHAVCAYTNGNEYRGGWRTGKRNGHGVSLTAKGERYEGKWVSDKRCGFGKLSVRLAGAFPGDREQSNSPERDFSFDELDIEELQRKHAIVTNSEGERFLTLYEGQWAENALHGDGLLFEREREGGEYYLGCFRYGFKDGAGRVHDIGTDSVLAESLFARNHIAPNPKILGQTTSIR